MADNSNTTPDKMLTLGHVPVIAKEFKDYVDNFANTRPAASQLSGNEAIPAGQGNTTVKITPDAINRLAFDEDALALGFTITDPAVPLYGLNGITDLTTADVREIINRWEPLIKDGSYWTSPIRTNLKSESLYASAVTSAGFLFGGCTSLEVAVVGNLKNIDNTYYLFLNCRKLREIIGTIRFASITQKLDKCFIGCAALETVQIQTAVSFWIGDCKSLSLASLDYLVKNAANTGVITVTVHADVYAKLTDPENAEWFAVMEAASAKNISFAQP